MMESAFRYIVIIAIAFMIGKEVFHTEVKASLRDVRPYNGAYQDLIPE